ncbi:MAG: alpha-L-rhamnosidase C-terminal domain-containing protein [Bacilli bacterium]
MRRVLGIEPLEPGYRTVAICPGPVPGMTRCEGTVNTLSGPLSVAWQWNGESAAVVVRECPPGVRVV